MCWGLDEDVGMEGGGGCGGEQNVLGACDGLAWRGRGGCVKWWACEMGGSGRYDDSMTSFTLLGLVGWQVALLGRPWCWQMGEMASMVPGPVRWGHVHGTMRDVRAMRRGPCERQQGNARWKF